MTFYTDGSCLIHLAKPNGNPGSFAWIQVDKGLIIKEYSLYMTHTTNNRMEMFALLSVLNYLYTNNIKNTTINICSDSLIVIKGFNGTWKTKANLDLWYNIFLLKNKLSSNTINLNWVKGHSNNKFNVYTDKLCKQSYKK